MKKKSAYERDEYRNSRITKLLERKENNLIELKKLKESIQDVNVNDIEMFNSNIELLTNNAEKLQNNIQTHIKLIATNEEQIKNIKQKINTLNELGDVCDKCERPVTEHDKKEVDKKLGNYKCHLKHLTKQYSGQFWTVFLFLPELSIPNCQITVCAAMRTD